MRYGTWVRSVLVLEVLCGVCTAAVDVNLLANGGFETAARLAPPALAWLNKQAVTFAEADPLLPVRWTITAHNAQVTLAPDAHGGRQALRVVCTNGSANIEIGVIEVVPGATYTFGAWSKGAGTGRLAIYGNAYEGRKDLARVDLPLSNAWAEARGRVTIPGNIRTVTVALALWGSRDACVDDVVFTADSATPFDANAVLKDKSRPDAHTLAFVDFDGQGQYQLENGAELTDAEGGRFGRGLRLEKAKASSAMIPLALERMPKQGTLEFWLSPDDDPKHIYAFLYLVAGSQDVMKLQADTSATLGLFWRGSGGAYDAMPGIRAGAGISRVWFRKGQWTHVAIQWDGEAVRYYLNGVLVSLSTEQPQPFLHTPSGIKLGSLPTVYSWSGVIDEVRLSDSQRYGPVVPLAATWLPLVAAPAPGTEVKAPKAKAPAAPDLAAERLALLGSIPPAPAGVAFFDATAMKPLIEGEPAFTLATNRLAGGLVTAQIGKRLNIGDPDTDGGYWKVDGFKPGSYTIGVWYGSGKAGAEANQYSRGALFVYLNGRVVQLATHSDPVQVAPGVYFAEAQARDVMHVKPGDEIAVLPARGDQRSVVRLTLYPGQPARGRGWMAELFHAGWFNRQGNLGLSLDSSFLAAPGRGIQDEYFRLVQKTDLPENLRRTPDGTRAVAQCRINNPLPVPLTVTYEALIRAYGREVVGTDRATLTLQPHQAVTREIAFTVIPDSRRYTIDAAVRAIKPPALADLGWPAAEPLILLPGLRQNLPWVDPFNAIEQRSLRFTGVLPGERVTFSLDGTWQSAFTTSLTPPVPAPADLTWTARQVPFPGHACSLDAIEPRPHGLYLRRTFTVPAGQEQKTWRVTVGSVIDEGTVYVNGQKTGNVRGSGTPLICDVTRSIKAGTNEIVIVLRDVLSIMDPAYVNPAAPVASKDYLDAPGGANCLAVDEVTLESSPAIAAGDLLVIPSVRKKELNARFNVTSHESAPRGVIVTARVLDAGQPILEVGREALTLAPGQTKALRFVKAWADPVLWGPGSAKLYVMAIETTDAVSGRRLDEVRERFGFRETWSEKGRIYYNGAPVRFKGTTCQGGGGINRDDVQWSRGIPVPDFADEFGYLANQGLAGIFNSSSRHNVEHDPFWTTAAKNVLVGAAFHGMHPSIISWDLSNEWLSFLDYGGGDPMAGARRFKTLADTLTAADPSRWIIFNGDEDLHGLHDTYCTHYMLESSNPHPIRGFGFRGHSNYFPDGAFFRPLDNEFTNGQAITINVHRPDAKYHYGSKPLMNTENMWKVSAYNPPGPSKFIGEYNVLAPAFDSGRGPLAWMWKLNNDGHRDLGVTAVCNYSTHPGVSRGGHMLQCFIMPDQTHHYYGGQTLERRYSLHNDRFTPAAYLFRWSLVDARGKVIRKGQDQRPMESGDLQRGRFALALPKVKVRTDYVLKLELVADGAFAYGEERDIAVWPDATVPVGTLGRTLFLFDPAGATAAAFAKAGIPFEPVTILAAPKGQAASSALVIGENALGAATADTLSPYVAAGGRVLVLAQTNTLAGLPVRIQLEAREWSSMPFVRTPQHPVLHGISSWDLHFWGPDRVSARGAYTKPEGGACVTLVDSGTDTGLEWVQMLECYRGRGLYLLTQLPVVGSDASEPMARELAARLVRYIAGPEPFRQPVRPLHVVAQAGSVVVDKLKAVGVDCRVVQPEAAWPADAAVLVDAGSLPASFAPPAAWQTALAQGATVVVHGPVPAQSNLLAALAGRPVALTAQPYGMWEGRGYRNGFTWLTAGLSQIDLYWKDYDGAEAASAQAEDPKLKIEDLCWWSARADGMTEHIFPGALVELPVGKGRLIVDTLRWETGKTKIDGLTARVVSAMMIGLGVGLEPYVPPRTLPKDITYQPVDLSAYCNRGFVDEVGDDGKGGWTDQGPKLDLRELPTGKQTFGGVPFLIGAEPRGCIVLKSRSRPHPELQPEEVTIPLGFPVEGLCFLHSLAYSGKAEAGRYQVQYVDGSAQEIVLVGELNLRDWAGAPAGFPREKGTQSRVAWTGSTKLFPVVCMYQMLWVNPRPEVAVKAVRFTNPTQAYCPVLAGLTAAIKGQTAGMDDRARQQVRTMMEKGLAAFNAGKDAEARTLLSEAIKLDPALDAAHQALGQVCERLQDEDATLAAYRAWAQAGARTPLPFNKIGAILERRKDYRGALDAYSRSLEIEWNQPPAIEAKRRLADLVGR
jgi:hypothetical protein